jgi:hypothetical protein
LSTIQKEDDSFAELPSAAGYALPDGFVPEPPLFEKVRPPINAINSVENTEVVDFLLK